MITLTRAQLILLLLVVMAATALAVGYRQSLVSWVRGRQAPPPPATAPAHTMAERTVLYWYDPMHPAYRSDKPGVAPDCGMTLVPRYADETEAQPPPATAPAADEHGAMQATQAEGEPGSQPAAAASPGNTIFIAPERQQLIGVKSVPATVRPVVKEIRTVGRVTYDETKLTHIHTKVTGYIEEVFVDFVGKAVTKGDPLFSIYSPELVSTQEEYLIALRGQKKLSESSYPEVAAGADSLVRAARERLRLWDISEEEIETLGKEGKVKRALTIYSPVSGIVTERAAYHHGRYVDPQMDLYTVVDLSTVWVLAEIYEYDLPFVRVGQTAEIEFPYVANAKPLRGKATFLYPYLNPTTRTTQIRTEFPNPELALRPDMFFNVKLRIDLGQQLAVPEDAVLDTGTEQYVFVDKGEGYFEPRPVKLGAEAGGYYVIQRGLEAGERVVTAANFILDSESRLKGVFANMGKPSAPQMGQPATAAQSLSVEMREPKEAKVGRNKIRLAVRDASGKPVKDADVEVTLSMPQMGSMPPMSSKAKLQHTGKGEYEGTIEVPMAWTWETTITVKKGGKVLGTVQTNITAR